MSANVETMFYVRTKPWHGLGVKVNEAPTSSEASFTPAWIGRYSRETSIRTRAFVSPAIRPTSGAQMTPPSASYRTGIRSYRIGTHSALPMISWVRA